MGYEIKADVDGHEYTFDSDVPNPSEDEILKAVGQFHGTDTAQAPQSSGIMDKIKSAVQSPVGQALASAVSPALGPLGMAADVVNSSAVQQGLDQPAQTYVGQPVEQKLADQGHPILGKLAGMAAALPFQPSTYMGGSLGKAAATGATEGAINLAKEATPSIVEHLTNVPKAATELMLQTKALPAGTPAEIETGVQKLYTTLKDVLKNEGEELGSVKDKLGIGKSFDQMVYEVSQGKDLGGYVTKLGNAKPEELLMEYQTLKATKGLMKDPEKLNQLLELQAAINDKVNTFGEVGNTLQGLMKGAARDIGDQIKKIPGGEELQAVRTKYAKARNLYDSLQPMLKDPGKAEEFLTKVFTSDNAGYKTIRDNLAVLEKLSGKPVMTDLFKQMAANSLNKVSNGPGFGRAITAGISAGAPLALTGHPIMGALAMAGGALGAAAQSPKVASMGLNAVRNIAVPAVRTAAPIVGAATGASIPTTLNSIKAFLNNRNK